MPEHIDPSQAAQFMRELDAATQNLLVLADALRRAREDRDALRRALHECAHTLKNAPQWGAALTKSTADTLVRLNLGGFND